MIDFQNFMISQVWGYALVFARLAGAIMLLPAFGELYVPARIRLSFAVLLTVLLAPLILKTIPAWPIDDLTFYFGEIAMGILLGFMVRLSLYAFEVAGNMMAQQMGFANASVFNPSLGQVGSLPGTYLTIMGVVLIFSLNLHHVMLQGVLDSYRVVPLGSLFSSQWLSSDVIVLFLKTVTATFWAAFQMASPFLVLGTIVFIFFGIINRLMPQIQVFFVAQPLQIFIGLILFVLILGGVASVFEESILNTLSFFKK